MTILRLQQVSVGYRQRPIMQGIDFSLSEGSVTCLLGANGCGKTTLLKTILGLLPALTGAVYLNGRALQDWRAVALARQVAYVPQAHHMLFPFRVSEVVAMGRTAHLGLFAAPSKRDKQRVELVLEQLSIAALAERRYNELSGGEQQLVLIARALTQQPSLLVMDEPAASLDFGNQIKILKQIGGLKQQGITILMSTHHPQHAQVIADSIILFHKCQPMEQGDKQRLLGTERLATLYDVSTQDIERYFTQESSFREGVRVDSLNR